MPSPKKNLASKVTKQKSLKPLKPLSVRKKRSISPEVQAKGASALAAWRKERDAAKAAGEAVYQEWLWREERKKALKRTTPMMAIKNFCNECLSGVRKDIKNCTAYQCPLYIYRPYQEESEDA